jgi:malate dehydrogenase (oxaloacetate-decarboxylating)
MAPELLVAATKAVAEQAPILKDPYAGLLPDIDIVREVSVSIAKGVIKAAVANDLARAEDIPEDDAVLGDWIREQQWEAKYRKLEKVHPDEASPHAKGERGPFRTAQ